MPEVRQLKRGMKPYRHGSIQLHFRDVLNWSKLPALPKSFGHVTNKPPKVDGGWNMYNNDQYGCCVCAGGEHEHMLFNMATGKPVPTFRNTNLSNYSRMLQDQNGVPLDPNNSDTDTGLDVAQAAKYRQANGLIDDQGNVHKVEAYALLHNVEELLIATYLFGSAGYGFNIPDSAEQQFINGEVWDDLTSQPSGGHYVPCMGRNSQGIIVMNTWDNLQGATEQYLAKRWSVGVAYFSPEYIMANGQSPELINRDALRAYLDQVSQA